MSELGKPMRTLDDQMRALDGEMRILDRRMEDALRVAEAEMRRLIAGAITSGSAERVR